MPTPSLVFSIAGEEAFTEAIVRSSGAQSGLVERRTFPDGEHYLRLVSDAAGRDVVVVGGTVSDRATLELYDLGCTAVENGARSLTLVVPFFGGQTMERAVRPGEAVTAKLRARILSSIPAAPFGNRALLLDLHTDGVPYYFEGALRAVHLSARPVVTDAIRRLGGPSYVLACTDAGRAKWVERLANALQVDAAFVFKRRDSATSTRVTHVSAQVDGLRVVIYDDMIRTGSSLVGAAQAYRDAGARAIAVVSTHGVLPADALAKLRATGLFERIVVTDSHPNARALADDFLEVVPVAPLFAASLAVTP